MAREVKERYLVFLRTILDIHNSNSVSLYVSDTQIASELKRDLQEVQRILETMRDEGYVKLYGKRSKGYRVKLHSWVQMELFRSSSR
jgi:tRNA G26 N,N-dimethylase Trm1